MNSTNEILYKNSHSTCSDLWDLGILLWNLDYNLKINVFVSIQINGQKTCEFEMHEVFLSFGMNICREFCSVILFMMYTHNYTFSWCLLSLILISTNLLILIIFSLQKFLFISRIFTTAGLYINVIVQYMFSSITVKLV